METIILEDLRHLGKTISAKEFKKSIEGGSKSIKYTQLVEWMTKEIQVLLGLEEHVNAITTEGDSSSFLLEVSSFLKELGCSYNVLTTGLVENRLFSNENKLLLLDYLTGELRASRIIKASVTNKKSNMQVTLIESNTSKCLKDILMTLKFPKPPQDITISSLFIKVSTKLQEFLKNVSPILIGKSLVCKSYNNEQWKCINKVIELLNEEFNIRRAMLLTRLDVTVQSFKWPERLKAKKFELEDIYQTKLNVINNLPDCSMSDFLCAREDLAIVEKTSSTLAVLNTNSSVNKVMIGRVPDRGGRPNEQQAPPPEMPSWQQRTQSQGGGRVGQTNRGGPLNNRGGQFNNKGGQGGGYQQNRGDNQSYTNPNSVVGFQSGTNVYQMTDGFQSITVGNESRNSYHNNGQGRRVQGGWNNDNRSYSNSGGQTNYDRNYSQGNHQNNVYYNNNNRFQGASNEMQWNRDPSQNSYNYNQDQYYRNNRENNRNDSSDLNRRGYSKRGRGHNGPTYYGQ